MLLNERKLALCENIKSQYRDDDPICHFPAGDITIVELIEGLAFTDTYQSIYQRLLSLGHKVGQAFTVSTKSMRDNGEEYSPRYLPEIVSSPFNKSVSFLLALHLVILGDTKARDAYMQTRNSRSVAGFTTKDYEGSDGDGKVRCVKEKYLQYHTIRWAGESEDVCLAINTLDRLSFKKKGLFQSQLLSIHESGIATGYNANHTYAVSMLKNIVRVMGQEALIAIQSAIKTWVNCDFAFNGHKSQVMEKLAFLSEYELFEPIANHIKERLDRKVLCKELQTAASLIANGKRGGDWLLLSDDMSQYRHAVEKEYAKTTSVTFETILVKAACKLDYSTGNEYGDYNDAFIKLIDVYMCGDTNKAIKPALLAILKNIVHNPLRDPISFAKHLTLSRLDEQVDSYIEFFDKHDLGLKKSATFMSAYVQCLLICGRFSMVRSWLTNDEMKGMKPIYSLYETDKFDVSSNLADMLDFALIADTSEKSALYKILEKNALDEDIKGVSLSEMALKIAIFIKEIGHKHTNKLMRQKHIFDIMVKMFDAKFLLAHTKGVVRTKVMHEALI